MNESMKEDTVLKSSSKYSKMPIEKDISRYNYSDILTLILTFVLLSIFLFSVFYIMFVAKNKGYQQIDLHPNNQNTNDPPANAQQNQNVNLCDIGENEKCLTCNQKDCGSCNLGYKLDKGKCVIDHTMRLTYETKNRNEFIDIINEDYVQFISTLIIDKQKINPTYKYIFQDMGEHVVTILLNKSALNSTRMMFHKIKNLISVSFTPMFSEYDIVNMKGMFSECINLKSIEFGSPIPKNIKDFSFMFDNCKSLASINLNNFNTSNALDISYMFSKCSSLTSIELKSFNTNNVVDMGGLFYECSSLSSIDFGQFSTKKTQNMIYMFAGCSSLNYINFNSYETNNVQDMSYMFKDCSKLLSLDLSKFNVKNVTNMNGMFMGCSSLTSLNITNFDITNLKYANKVFEGCKNLTKEITSSPKFIELNSTQSKLDEKEEPKEKLKEKKNKKRRINEK